ncbi:prolipoprotein diacylglyceryl transferase [Granulicella sp. WH15]|uniref:prolipoprotein diacylglyceryl transferase n=1 Tax=Granulicella sp. WH15 TaxID=2602070 RepID=UPI0013678D3F|nr:prolipoprotein diacylglyceryl transferase family protein [Granulicella sp. WH15]QHN04093.1 prolipoprotein diacylglyceryl transferase [Granulicella sp. WH15]
MYPYLNIGPLHLGTFGLLLWLAAVAATVMLHRSFTRDGVDGDALNIVAMVVIAGVIGAKTWHELQSPKELAAAMHLIVRSAQGRPVQVVIGFLHWFQAGFAWFGGMLAGIGMLMWQGSATKPNGMTGLRASARMLDLAAPAAAIGYGVGRLGCLTSGDGDYGRNTTSHFWGVHMSREALVPVNPPDALVLPTPLWEFGIAMVFAWVLWRLAGRPRPLGWLTGLYLVLSGVARFLVEFERINPRLYWGMSNAQVAALGSVAAGVIVMIVVRGRAKVGGPVVAVQSVTA